MRYSESSMRLVTFQQPGSVPEAGIVEGNRVQGLGVEMISVCAAGRVPDARGPSFDLASVRLLAPVPRPPKLICVGLNYRDHAAESRSEIPKVPTIFSKFSNVVIGPGDPIVLPKASRKPDYEAEFAFVIGRGGRHIPAAKALDHVLGYTIANDVSARDFQTATTQWLMGKTFDTFAPMGPWIVTKDEIADPHALDISLEIGGETLQSSNTREMVFRIPELIEYVSTAVTLEPGDVFITGTPAGVGFGRKPPRWLKPGEEVVVRIAGIGELRNPTVAEE
jgi:2-keto-4-pentenoate hydratase/2-oxohepta-3-ene-1,7-dioic acid hydratase in catechol pathway